VKPPPFAYHAPATTADAVARLAEVAPQGKVLAGGQSLIPMLNMRLAAPRHLVDINGVRELDTVEVTSGGVRVGALARHARVERCRAPERVALECVGNGVVENVAVRRVTTSYPI
jgi:aerobic carbon-monoxide dehydrogenase medium subunit